MFALVIAAILYLSLFYVCGRFTAKYAAQKGRSTALWFVLGCLFYPFPYVALALLPPLRNDGPRDPGPREDGRRSEALQRPQRRPFDWSPRIAVSVD